MLSQLKDQEFIRESISGGIVIINGNDVVMNENSTFTDNDKAAFYTACAVGADTLLCLSDVRGILDKDNNVMQELNRSNLKNVMIKNSGSGTGGVKNKIRSGLKHHLLASEHILRMRKKLVF